MAELKARILRLQAMDSQKTAQINDLNAQLVERNREVRKQRALSDHWKAEMKRMREKHSKQIEVANKLLAAPESATEEEIHSSYCKGLRAVSDMMEHLTLVARGRRGWDPNVGF